MSDLYLIPTSDGGEIIVTDGKPRMTSGLDNAVYLSLFTESWWGNAESPRAERYASRIPALLSRELTNQTRLAIMDEARRALQWMLDEGVADDIRITAEIPKTGTLYLSIQFDEPTAEDFAYGINWDAQEVSLI